jgi:hypothetical protein
MLKQYWWVLVILAIVGYIWFLRSGIESRDLVIEQQKQTIALKIAEIQDAKVKLETQNKAIDDMAQKGKEQAARLDGAIKRVNDMKPATQVIVREIYKDSAKDANALLFNALTD